jgi:ferredoxin
MSHVVTNKCYDCRYTDCVIVCPVDCFYGDEKSLYIDSDSCIDCGCCVNECPVSAIYEERDVPKEYENDIENNETKVKELKDWSLSVVDNSIIVHQINSSIPASPKTRKLSDPITSKHKPLEGPNCKK